MIAINESQTRDNLTVLPERDEPYRLEAVYELFRDGCRSEIVLQFDGGSLRFRSDEDDDTIDFDFRDGEFGLSRDYKSVVPLTGPEIRVLSRVAKSPAFKGRNGITAKVAGAATKADFGKQGGGLLKRGLIASKLMHGKVHYEITAAGRRALGSAAWSKLIGKKCEWSWVACNQQGYRDSVMLAFDGIVPTVLLCVMASSIEVYSITG